MRNTIFWTSEKIGRQVNLTQSLVRRTSGKVSLFLSLVGLGLACGLVLRLRLASGLYKWLFYLATVRQLNHVVIIKRRITKNALREKKLKWQKHVNYSLSQLQPCVAWRTGRVKSTRERLGIIYSISDAAHTIMGALNCCHSRFHFWIGRNGVGNNCFRLTTTTSSKISGSVGSRRFGQLCRRSW